MEIIVYDTAIYRNTLFVSFLDTTDSQMHTFEVSARRDQRPSLREWMNHREDTNVLLGFRNHLHANVLLDRVLRLLYQPLADFFVELTRYYAHLQSLSSPSQRWQEAFDVQCYFLKSFNSVDIYRLGSGVTSLRAAAVLMNDPDVSLPPVRPHEEAADTQLDSLRQHHQRQVDIIHRLWQHLEAYGVVEVRQVLYDMGLLSPSGTLKHLSHSDSRLGEEIFRKQAAPNYRRFKLPELVDIAQRTKHPELIAYYERLAQCTFLVTENLDITSNDPWHVHHRERMIRVGQQRLMIRESGLYSKQKLAVARSDDDYTVLHLRVSGLDPHTMQAYQLLPPQLQGVYEELVEQKALALEDRQLYRASAAQLSLNAVSGKWRRKRTNLYDGRARLLQSYLAQAVLVQVLQALYDQLGIHAFNVHAEGIMASVRRVDEPAVQRILKHSSRRWQVQWRTEAYQFVYQTHVNEYFAIRDDGQLRTIGSYGRYPYRHFKYYLKKDVGAYLRQFLYHWYQSERQLRPAAWLQRPHPPQWFFMDAGVSTWGKGKKVELRSGQVQDMLRYYYARHDDEQWYNVTDRSQSRLCAEQPIRSCESYDPDGSHHDLPDISLAAYQQMIERHLAAIERATQAGMTYGQPVDPDDQKHRLPGLPPLEHRWLAKAICQEKEKEFFALRYQHLDRCEDPERVIQQDMRTVRQLLLAHPHYRRDSYYWLQQRLPGCRQIDLFHCDD